MKKYREPVVRNTVQIRDWVLEPRGNVIFRIQTKCNTKLTSQPILLAYSPSISSFLNSSSFGELLLPNSW